MEQRKDQLKVALAALWLAFTVALATWWLIFGLRQIEQTASGPHHYYRMLLWEGGVLIGLLLLGGVVLVSYVWRERCRHRQSEEFFAAFTHDAKTALASLRLQAESLREDLGDGVANPVLERLLKDTLRLQLQLENSLFLVNLRSGRLLPETLRLSRIVESLRFHWPELVLQLHGDGAVLADARALESVLTNLIQNAVIHGQAKQITLTVEAAAPHLRLRVADDGCGFAGDFRQLGVRFLRHTHGSGSGMGLYIARQLTQRMSGSLAFAPGALGGFVAELTLPQAATVNATNEYQQVTA